MEQKVEDKLLRLVTKQLFDYELGLDELCKIENTFLGRVMLKSVEEVWKEAIIHYDSSSEGMEEFVEEVYQKMWGRIQSYLRGKLHIDINDIISISSLYYEGAEVNGNLYFALENIKEAEIPVRLKQHGDQIELNRKNWRKIRKWLEMTNDLDDKKIPGLLFVYENGKWIMKGIIEEASSSCQCFRFHFTRHMVWELYEGNENILNYSGGSFFKPLIDKEKEFDEELNRILKNNSEKERKRAILWPLVANAMEQKHGTILVLLFGAEADAEADRICTKSTGTRTDGKLSDATMIKRLTAVDGAVLVKEDGSVLAYGVILDSEQGVEVEPEQGRGSRFLSGKKYAASLRVTGKVGLVVIVSEDGMVNFYSTEKGDEDKNENRC